MLVLFYFWMFWHVMKAFIVDVPNPVQVAGMEFVE